MNTFSPYDFGAVGDGQTDDWLAWTQAIQAAQAVGGVVKGDAGAFALSMPLQITNRVTIRGAGYCGDEGNQYAGRLIASANRTGCILLPHQCNGIEMATNAAVLIEGLEIGYPVKPPPGTAGISCASAAGTTASMGVNTDSIIRDVFIYRADYGIAVQDWYDFDFDNVRIQDAVTTSIQIAANIYPSYGDWTITGGKLSSGTVSYHVAVLSGGGGRLNNIKMNYGNPAPNGCGVIIYGTGNSYIEPFRIDGCSIEGQQCGVVLERAPGSTTQCSMVEINSQINCANGIRIVAAPDGSPVWVQSIRIAGGINVNPGGICVSLDGVNGALIHGILSSAGGASSTGIYMGPHATNVVSNVVKLAGVI